jgi:hypothetical protein
MKEYDFEISFDKPHSGWMRTYIRVGGFVLDTSASYIEDPLQASAEVLEALNSTTYCDKKIIIDEEGPQPTNVRFRAETNSETCLISVANFDSPVDVIMNRNSVARILRKACRQIEPLLDKDGWEKEWHGFPRMA